MTLKSFLQKIKAALSSFVEGIQDARMKQVERYLAQSYDLYDLEYRQRRAEDFMAGKAHTL